MSKTIVVGTNAFLAAAKKLVKYGEITEEQYLEMVARNEELSNEQRLDTIIYD